MRNEELFKEKPVWSAILTLAIPSVLSVLVMLLYNMADMFFVGLLQENICQGGFHRKDEIPDKQELFSLFEFFDCKLISFLNQRF